MAGTVGGTDPDLVAWRCIPDFSCGVPGGTEDNRAYFLSVLSPKTGNPGAPDGTIAVLYWATPYDNTSVYGWNIPIATQGGGMGLIDESNPAKMALAADDNTLLSINGNPATSLWILDSVGKVQSVVIVWTTGDAAYMNTQLTSAQYGSRTPVDIEIANALDFGYQVGDPGFNWLAVLLDNGDNTWSVGVWEYDYLVDPATFTEIDITDPLPGTPYALDVDPHDFEIHVLSETGGNIEATVFEYVL
jgi:hypothetical protein